MRSAPAIGFEYRRSPTHGGLLSLMLALAWLALVACDWPGACRLLLALAAGLAYVGACRRWRTPRLYALVWLAPGSWQARLADGREVPARLHRWHGLGGSRLWLDMALVGVGRQQLWLGPDNLDADTLRQLRMRLMQFATGVPPPAL